MNHCVQSDYYDIKQPIFLNNLGFFFYQFYVRINLDHFLDER